MKTKTLAFFRLGKPPAQARSSAGRGPGVRALFRRIGLLAAVMAPALAYGQVVSPNPAAAGLWIGEARLNFVSRPSNGANESTPAPAQVRLILHVDAAGKVRLLKDVMIARRSGGGSLEIVLVTDPARLSTLPLATDQATANIAGQRFATVSYDFTDNDSNGTDRALDFTGGLGVGFECRGSLLLAKDHVTNPFRHKYHSDHANEGTQAYQVTRNLRLHSFTAIEDLNGTTQVGCSYEEKIAGLHRSEITVEGTVVLRRVVTTAVLNQ